MKTIAIDFETANEERGSACSVGLAWIEDGVITRVEERLIRPKEMRFSHFNIAVHGIRPADVEDAPEFPEVMEEFVDEFREATMIAHNAAFDFSVMRASFDKYRQSYPSLSYFCSVKMAQRVWPSLPSHKLNIIAHHLQLRFVHHNAAEMPWSAPLRPLPLRSRWPCSTCATYRRRSAWWRGACTRWVMSPAR